MAQDAPSGPETHDPALHLASSGSGREEAGERPSEHAWAGTLRHDSELRAVLDSQSPTKPMVRVYVAPHWTARGDRYRGLKVDEIRLSQLGVNVRAGAEAFVNGEWAEVVVPKLIPWHRVDLVEWEPDGG